MTATCHQLRIERYLDIVSDETGRFASLVEGADAATPVPTCPGWTLKDLAEHIGSVHRWAANQVRVLTPKRLPSADMDLGVPDDFRAFGDWMLAGAADLLETLRSADPDAEMWAWGSDKHARFWPRRMAHETTVHRADAELALGIAPVTDPAVAVDGIDELLDNLPHAAYFAPKVSELRGNGEALTFQATDAPAEWLVALHPDAFAWEHAGGDAAVVVEGSVTDLILFAYGRRKPGDRVTARGDEGLLARWVENSAI